MRRPCFRHASRLWAAKRATREYRSALQSSKIIEHRCNRERCRSSGSRRRPSQTTRRRRWASRIPGCRIPACCRAWWRPVGPIDKQLDVVSPYFVPMANGTESFARLARRASRCVCSPIRCRRPTWHPVHAGYSKRRKALLEAGVQLVRIEEFRRSRIGIRRLGAQARRVCGEPACQDLRRRRGPGVRRLFQFRSALGGTQYRDGLRRARARRSQAPCTMGSTTKVPQMAYEVRLNARQASSNGSIASGAEETILTTEPETSAFKRGIVKFLSWLPIDWML